MPQQKVSSFADDLALVTSPSTPRTPVVAQNGRSFADDLASTEAPFRQWYGTVAKAQGLPADPDDPAQFYDYRAAFAAGAKPDASGHWPSQFKRPGHPNEVVGGFNTITGQRVPDTPQAGEDELVRLGWSPEDARRMSAPPPRPMYPAAVGPLQQDLEWAARQVPHPSIVAKMEPHPANPRQFVFRPSEVPAPPVADTPRFPSAISDPSIDPAAGTDRPMSPLEREAVGRSVVDPTLTAINAAIAVPEAAVGLVDIPTGGRVGKALEFVGFKPLTAKQILSSYYTDSQQRANRTVRESKGFVSKAISALSNPSVILHNVIESAPLMVGGAGVARALLRAVPGMAPMLAGAIGEGATQAGSMEEQVRQESETGLTTAGQGALALSSGVATSALGLLGGKIAERLGIADVDTMLAAAAASPRARKGLARAVIYGGFQEGLEEFPQGISEQVHQNIAQGKPWDEDVDDNAVMSALAGVVMSVGPNVASHYAQDAPMPPPAAVPVPMVPREAHTMPEFQPLSRPLGNAPTTDVATTAQAQVQSSATAEPNGWDGLVFRQETGDRWLPTDTPPERTPNGDYVFYHGTSPGAVDSIVRSGLKKDDLGKVGLGTTPGRVRMFGSFKAGLNKGRVLRVVIDKDFMQSKVLTREGDHKDLFLLTKPFGEKWEGVPRSAIVALDDVTQDVVAGMSEPTPQPEDAATTQPSAPADDLPAKTALQDKIIELDAELGHPFGDRDDWTAFLETAPEDVSIGDLQSAYGDLLEYLTKTRAAAPESVGADEVAQPAQEAPNATPAPSTQAEQYPDTWIVQSPGGMSWDFTTRAAAEAMMKGRKGYSLIEPVKPTARKETPAKPGSVMKRLLSGLERPEIDTMLDVFDLKVTPRGYFARGVSDEARGMGPGSRRRDPWDKLTTKEFESRLQEAISSSVASDYDDPAEFAVIERAKAALQQAAAPTAKGKTRFAVRPSNPQTKTPEFQRWFGDSMLRDEGGAPRVLYHGTADDVTEFDLDHPHRKDTGWLGTGVYLTSSADLADAYTMLKAGDRPNILPLYARLENPYRATLADKQRLQLISASKGKEAGRAAADAWTEKLKARGYDGVILRYDAKQVGEKNVSDEVVVFDPSAVKSATGNSGSFDPNTNDVRFAVRNKAENPQVNTEAFRKWFGDSKVVDENGSPRVVYHGTTADFPIFDPSKGNIESDLGRSLYFTSAPSDANANYAGVGPDLASKIERRYEQLEGQFEGDLTDRVRASLRREAKAEFVQHKGMTMPVFLKMDNPAVLGGSDETRLEVSEEFDEEGDPIGEPTGTLMDFVEALRSEASYYDGGEVDQAIANLFDEAYSGDGGVSVRRAIEILRESEQFGYYEDPDSGALASNEIIRRALERSGFDGIIDRSVDTKFGSQRRIGQKMKGMDPDTVHYLVFKPTQIKSAIGNSGAFDPTTADIRYATRQGEVPSGEETAVRRPAADAEGTRGATRAATEGRTRGREDAVLERAQALRDAASAWNDAPLIDGVSLRVQDDVLVAVPESGAERVMRVHGREEMPVLDAEAVASLAAEAAMGSRKSYELDDESFDLPTTAEDFLALDTAHQEAIRGSFAIAGWIDPASGEIHLSEDSLRDLTVAREELQHDAVSRMTPAELEDRGIVDLESEERAVREAMDLPRDIWERSILAEVTAPEGAPGVRYSVRSWDEKGRNTFISKAKALGFPKKLAEAGVDMVDAIAGIFRAHADVLPNLGGKNKWTGEWLKALVNNADFVFTLDVNRTCKRVMKYWATVDDVEKKVGRPLSEDELLALGQRMRADGNIPGCIFCYVEASRRAARRNAHKFATMSLPDILSTMNKKDKAELVEVAKRRDALLQKLGWSLEKFSKWAINPDAIVDAAKRQGGDIGELATMYNKYVLSAKGTSLTMNGTYLHEFLEMDQAKVDSTNERAGVRMLSATDFDPTQLVDTLQAMLDMTVRKLAAHEYTKEPYAVYVLGRTGVKQNMSIAVRWDEKAQAFTEDLVNGMEHKLALKLRADYPNAGTMFVAKNMDELMWGLDNPDIDMIIPHHAANWTGGPKKYGIFGLDDFSARQHEHWVNPKAVPADVPVYKKDADGNRVIDKYRRATPKEKFGNKLVINYWLKRAERLGLKDQDAKAHAVKAYLAFCRKSGLTPKWAGGTYVSGSVGKRQPFADLTTHPNYIKLLQDYARADSPQRPVNALDMDMGMAREYLSKFVEDLGWKQRSTPNPHTVSAFVAELKSGKTFDLDALRSAEQAVVANQRVINLKIVQNDETDTLKSLAARRKALRSFRLGTKAADSSLPSDGPKKAKTDPTGAASLSARTPSTPRDRGPSSQTVLSTTPYARSNRGSK